MISKSDKELAVKVAADITINSVYIAAPGLITAGVVKQNIYWVIIPGVILGRTLLDDKNRAYVLKLFRKVKRGLCRVNGTMEFQTRMFA